ncbi:hypothetical protein G7078_01080 [Sphingomonas sinipercae]|uniref:Uncharacterized protein n=1 Tax=Sphingomonas sinipercae TaxID=2714944 RepID=A0A6G7ZKT2_9SPHN|nr:hypothetical protein [Sphingomonas sinipercae]QIL01520.1 hypothetical protein G7078_01080 [Sphingomonas sinipercae]
MFNTVRHWWDSGRGKMTVRLFLFELFVVIIGVLIAQSVAGYAQRQSELRHMEAERSRLQSELEGVHAFVKAWRAGVPCLAERMTQIMSGASFRPSELRRPRFPTPAYAAPSTEVLDLLAAKYGAKDKDDLNWVGGNVANSSTVIASIIARWGRLMLIDPANGQVTASDRAEARMAAADIKAQLRAMEVIANDTDDVLTRMNVGSRNPVESDYGPATSCAAIWNSGRLDPLLRTK